MDENFKQDMAEFFASMKPPKVPDQYFLERVDDLPVGNVVMFPSCIGIKDQQKFVCYAPDGLEPKPRVHFSDEVVPDNLTPVWMIMMWGPMTDAVWFIPIIETLYTHGLDVGNRVACAPEVFEHLLNRIAAQRLEQAVGDVHVEVVKRKL